MMDERNPPLVAVIEDDEIERAALGRLLHVGGFGSALFESGEAFVASRPRAALLCLIVDVQLGGMSGLDLQMRLHSEGFAVPVIIITGNRLNAIREHAERAGCAAFLWKPFSAEAILPLLSSIAREAYP